MESKNPRTYTADEKRRATKHAAVVGAAQAGIELGIPAETLSCWVFRA